MIFRETPIQGAFIIETEPIRDERGSFARSFCAREFEAYGLNPRFVQCNISFNRKSGTLRGMHYQAAPHREAKLVRCTRGWIFDAIVDLRRDSPTFTKWHALELNEHGRELLYVPEGCAHGYLTLADGCEVSYQVSAFYSRDTSRGVRWNDPAFAIRWPREPAVISDQDRNFAAFDAMSPDV
jgi:dTDP-4-dehydrorhamnose 3,5-epimerase